MTLRALLPLTKEGWKQTFSTLSPTERAILGLLLVLLTIGLLGMLWKLNSAYFLEIPAQGGTYTEGIVGTPRFINPLLASGDADQDLTSLVYVGLLKPTGDGGLTAALADHYEVSDDGLIYMFTLRDDAVFHDGMPVTADDVVFTVERAQDPALKSPRRANWEGVRVEKVGDKQVQFTLSRPYGPFLENTVMGILPLHIWKEVGPDEFPFSQFNVEPIGAGPYTIEKLHRTGGGLPEYYELSSFEDYVLGEPHISKLVVRLYPSEEALLSARNAGDVDAMSSVSPQSLVHIKSDKSTVLRAPLPRVFGVFFNQNAAPLFAHKIVREAVATAIDREKIIQQVFGGYGRITEGPIPPGILTAFGNSSNHNETSIDHAQDARDLLEADGWKPNEAGQWSKTTKEETQILRFALSTSNTPELKAVAEILKEQWQAAGIDAELKFFDTSDLNQNVIRPRRYDALLFGEIVGRDLDLFPFWHSSQRNDPGLNIALYANISADKYLEDARTTSDGAKRVGALELFADEVMKDTPAAFIYSPDFIYVVPSSVHGIVLGPLTTSGERFLGIENWYIETERVWPFVVNLPSLKLPFLQ